MGCRAASVLRWGSGVRRPARSLRVQLAPCAPAVAAATFADPIRRSRNPTRMPGLRGPIRRAPNLPIPAVQPAFPAWSPRP